MAGPGEGVVECLKKDRTRDMFYGEVYHVVDQDATTGRPIMDVPDDNNQSGCGVVMQDSKKGNSTVVIRFSGMAKVKYLAFFGGAPAGSTLGSFANQTVAIPNASGLGEVISDIQPGSFFTPGYALARLTGGGESVVRWKEYDP